MRPRIWLLAILASSPIAAQENLLASHDRWTIAPASGGSFERENGEFVLRLRSGNAKLDRLDFEDGTISFDLKLTHRAAFVGILFRAGERDAEHVYLRPHRSGLWDAIQYQPIMNGSSTWQLHRGEGYTGPVDLPHGQWFSVRLEIQGAHADLYVGETMVPTMQIALERGITSGGIAFTAGFRGAAPEGEIAGTFRRLIVDPWPAASGEWTREAPADDSFIRTWSVSQPFELPTLPATTLPARGDTRTVVEAEPRGLVNLSRNFARVSGAERSAVVAYVVIRATHSVQVPLDLDFSDDVSVFLNDQLLFTGTNAWESRYPFYLGTIAPDVLLNQVQLNLREGNNYLSLVVSERAFGWGFLARLERPSGVEIQVR